MRLATVAISVLLVWALPSAVAQAGAPESGAAAAAVSQANKPGLKKALKKCRTIRKVNRRKACIRKARKRFSSKPSKPVKPVEPKPGKTWRVDVLDDYINDYFSPDSLEIETGDQITWVWSDSNQNPHNISLISGPPGIDRFKYATPNSPSRNYSWTRQLNKPGMWVFGCSLHQFMRMAVKVGK